MKTNSTTSKIVIAACAAALLLAGYVYLYWDLMQTNAAITLAADDISKDSSEEQIVISLRQTVASVQNDQALLDSLFVDNDKVAPFLQSVESLADTAGVTHTLNIDLQADTSLAPYNKELLRFHMTTIGSWADTVRFMTLLENMPNKLYVSSVEVRQDGGGKAGGVWNADYDFTVVKNK